MNRTGTTAGSITSQDIVFSVLYSIIVLAGVTGNIIVLVIVRKTPAMHTVTNYLLANLATADLLTLLFCPGMYDFALKGINLDPVVGEIVCKLFAGNAVTAVAVNASIIALCTLAIERYLALVKPFKTELRLTKRNVKYAIGVIWLLALLSNVLDLKDNIYEKDGGQPYPCNRPWTVKVDSSDKQYVIIFCILAIILPVFIIFFCNWQIVRGIYCTGTVLSGITDENDRQCKIKLCKLLILLAVIFTACCLPFAVFFIFLSCVNQSAIAAHYDALYFVHRIVRFLLFSNSFINPFSYAMQSSNYRQNFKRIFSSGRTQTRRQEIELDCQQGQQS